MFEKAWGETKSLGSQFCSGPQVRRCCRAWGSIWLIQSAVSLLGGGPVLAAQGCGKSSRGLALLNLTVQRASQSLCANDGPHRQPHLWPPIGG